LSQEKRPCLSFQIMVMDFRNRKTQTCQFTLDHEALKDCERG